MKGLLPFVGTGVAGRQPIPQDRRIETAAVAPVATPPAPAPAPAIERIDVDADVLVRPQPVRGEPPVRQPRRRRAWVVAIRGAVSVIILIAAICLVSPGLLGAWSIRSSGGLPRTIELPWRWQANAEANPPGLAAVVATGDRIGLHRGDASNQVVVVGRDGTYSGLYPNGRTWHAGDDVHLSPDGRNLAAPNLHTRDEAGLSITDLVSGQTRTLGLPVHDRTAVLGWRPDGAALLVGLVTGDDLQVVVIEIEHGRRTALATLPGDAATLPRWRFAFSPDGARVVMAVGGELRLVDRGGTLWTIPLPPGHTLAGAGAFTPDGLRVALVHSEACSGPCSIAPPWAVTYVDSGTGAAADGPPLPTIIAAEIRAVGWSGPSADSPGGLVVVRYLPRDYPIGERGSETAGPADLYELAPGASPRLLLDAPYEVTDLDVAADLVRAARFEDTPSVPSLLPIEAGRVRLADFGIALSVLGGLTAVVAVIFGLASRARPRRRAH